MALTVPDTGLRLADANAIANAINGDNQVLTLGAQNTGTGTTQATGYTILKGVGQVEFNTVTTGAAVNLPLSAPGMRIMISNNTNNAFNLFTNPLETGTPKINQTTGTSGISFASNTNAALWCSTAGQWYRVSGT